MFLCYGLLKETMAGHPNFEMFILYMFLRNGCYHKHQVKQRIFSKALSRDKGPQVLHPISSQGFRCCEVFRCSIEVSDSRQISLQMLSQFEQILTQLLFPLK